MLSRFKFVLVCAFLLSVNTPACFGDAGKRDTVFLPCLDKQSRALGIYVPPGYNPKKPVPLFIWLHGGVNRPEKNRGAGAVAFFMDQASQYGFLTAAPSGEKGATWFDPVGLDHFLGSLRYMTSHYAVDMKRIFIGGSSDGGTACYLLAMQSVLPKIRGFAVCSGFSGMLPYFGVQFDPAKCQPYSWFIVHTGKDRLYPLLQVQKSIDALKKAGCSVVFHTYPDLPHGLDYAGKENPLIAEWILSH